MPEFSIIIPAYNRGKEISRAVESCFAQDFTDFEVVVIDDGSTDATFAAARTRPDPRLRVLRHESNRGQAAATNLGAQFAGGEWLIPLDSDDELLPGALNIIHKEVQVTGREIERIAFMYRRDDGRVSPHPALVDQTVDYRAWMIWLQDRELYDFLTCTRRFTFQTVPYPDLRQFGSWVYHFDFAKRYTTRFCPQAAAYVHTDAAARSSTAQRDRANAAQCGADLDVLLANHGDAMRELAPRLFQMHLRMRASYHFLAGQRADGCKQILRCLRARPFHIEAWALLALGALGSDIFAAARSRKYLVS